MKKLNQFMGLCVLLIVTATGFVGCNKDEKPKPSKGVVTTDAGLQEELTGLHIVDSENRPIPNAQILIGPARNAPFEGNFGVTDDKGVFALPVLWTSPEVVTIDAPGYLRASYFSLPPQPYKIQLKKKFVATAELRGRTSGHPVRNKDGYIDYSLVMSAMTRQDLLNFQIQKVLSPVDDTVTAVGMKMPIPSNVSLPKQTESYFINITLEKPQYRLFLGELGFQRVFAARGRFLFKPVVDGLRNNADILSLINYFTITGGSIRDVNIKDSVTTLNIPVMDLTFSQKRAYTAPPLSKGQVMVVLPVADNNGHLIPTDVKRLSAGQSMNLSIWDENPSYIAQVLKNDSEFDPNKPGMDRLSASLLPFDENLQSQFLPLIKNPAALSRFSYSLQSVDSQGLNKLLTYAVISDVKTEQKEDGSIIKTPNQVWEIYAPSWVTQISLPQWEWTKTAPLTRFEVSFVASTTEVTAPMGPQLMEKATHVTRSSTDF